MLEPCRITALYGKVKQQEQSGDKEGRRIADEEVR
jgi:hypothetical protein